MYSRWIAKVYGNDEALNIHLRRVAEDLLADRERLRNRDPGRWMRLGPCPGCPCEEWCDTVCPLRAKWWDDFCRGVMGK